jgi:hypothetical protein
MPALRVHPGSAGVSPAFSYLAGATREGTA